MTPERWQRIDWLFHATLACPPAGRANFLAGACEGDEPLRQEVEGLISFHDEAQSFIEVPAGDLAAELLGTHKSRFAPGQQIDSYKIVRKLASGGMGEVYLADDPRLNRKIALKLLPPQFTIDPDRVRRFEQEARAASALNHPNIVTIHEIGETDSIPFIATEFVEGETLREHMAKTRMTVGEVIDVASQIASALQAAHEAGIVHRDIKPENIMLRRDRIVKVLDFGLAKLAPDQVVVAGPRAPTRSTVNTNPGVVMGTVTYMSPEQARCEEVDARTDVWSLGVVLYEMVTGRAPSGGETPSHVIVSILESEPAALAREVEVPRELERIISKALQKDRGHRYQTAGELALDLKSLKEELTVESRLKRFRRSDTDGKKSATKSDGRVALRTAHASERSTADVAIARLTSSAEYLVNGIRRHRGSAVFALTTLFLVASIVYFSSFNKGGGAAIYFSGWGKSRLVEPNRQIKSIAVLPFRNLSGDAGQEYFNDGMTEAMINELAKIGALRVISRQSMMQYKDARKTTPEIARQLNVDAIVDGSVLRSGDRVRITAQLIRAATDEHLWSDNYERDLHDVLALQSEIARSIAGKIRIKLTPQEQERLTRTQPIEPAAHEAYLKGRYSLNQAIDTPESDASNRLHKKSTEYFEQAIKFDSNYALAYSGLALSYHWLASSGFPEFYPKSKEAALKALALDDTLDEAHGALAFTIWRHDRDFAGAGREFQKAEALASNPGNLNGYAQFLSTIGRHDEAIRRVRLAEDSNPLTMFVKLHVGWIYLDARQYDNAIGQFQRVLELEPETVAAHSGLGIAYVLKGMYAEGIAEFQTALKLSGAMSARAHLAWAYALAGQRGDAIKILDEVKDASQKSIPHLRVATIYGALGEKELGMAQLEMAYAKRHEGLLWLQVDPRYDGLRSDPRFTDLLRRIGFPSELIAPH